MKNNIATGVMVLVLLGVLAVPVAAHSLWVESKDIANIGDCQKVYSFFGHAGSSSGMYVPLMDSTFLINPEGQRLNLTMQTGDWLPGFGWMKYAFSDVVLYWPGDYVLASIRAPGVFDMAWHGGKSNPMLVYDYAKCIIHCGNTSKNSWTAGFPLEISFEKEPYQVKSNDNFTAMVSFKGKPVPANYTAWYWTVDAHSSPDAQRGRADEDGKFMVTFNKSGPWVIEVSHITDASGNWTATYSNPFYKKGDIVPYKSEWYRSTLTVWVK